MALLFAGVDESGPQLYCMDPSGTYVQYDAKAIGSGSEGAQQTLVEMYNKVRILRAYRLVSTYCICHCHDLFLCVARIWICVPVSIHSHASTFNVKIQIKC